MNLTELLKPTKFLDSDSESVKTFALNATKNAKTDIEKAIRLYYAVRDSIRYDPYKFYLNKENFTASNTLNSGSSYCIPKAILLAAAARAVGIPAQLGFSDVKNHLSTQKLLDLMETDVFIWHGYTVLYLDGKWVKATPAFNIEMCERFNVKPLEFDGISDSFMHPFNQQDQQHMEYLTDHGSFADLPYETLIDAIKKTYPKFCTMLAQQQLRKDYNFNQEVITTN
ncbi:MAG: transglutaminase family protein [Cycloclasticus sp.]|jgi:transglutaminase-like putative cysteine protease|nr:transglutaminase family protein [Cycloclasticus sp.]MEE4290481.1 transglutaminase family protein [Cycloclasticus sp.]